MGQIRSQFARSKLFSSKKVLTFRETWTELELEGETQLGNQLDTEINEPTVKQWRTVTSHQHTAPLKHDTVGRKIYATMLYRVMYVEDLLSPSLPIQNE